MPYLLGSAIVQADTSVLQDASGNDIAEQDWDFSALTATISGQGQEVLTRIGPPQSDLFSYAHSTNDAVIPIAGIVETVATLLGIVQTLQQLLGTDTVGNDSLFHYLLEVWNQVGLQGTPWPVIGQQADDNATAILNAISDLSGQVGGLGSNDPHGTMYRVLTSGVAEYAPDPTAEGPAPVLGLENMVAGESREAFLAREDPTRSWTNYSAGSDMLSTPVDAGNPTGPRWVFKYNSAEWCALGGGPSGQGGANNSNADVLAAISALRGGAATVQGVGEGVIDAVAAAVAAEDAATAARGGTATIQNVHDDLAALVITEPPTAAEIAAEVWSTLLSGETAGNRLITASGLDVDLTPVTDAIAALRGGTATVQQVLTAVQGLSFPDVPTESEIAAAVWTYLINGTASGTLLNTAATRPLPRVPPVWPGQANVTLGTPVAFDDTFSITAQMHGVIIVLTTSPQKLGQYNIGGEPYYFRMGRISFADEQGRLEPWVYTGFEEAIYLPRTLQLASAVHVQVLGGAEGTCTPFTIT